MSDNSKKGRESKERGGTIKDFYGAFLAGFLIGIGCVANARLGYPLGAAVFGLGLFSVLVYQIPLYTGRIGFCETSGAFAKAGAALVLNFLGAIFLGAIFFGAYGADPKVDQLIETKLALPWGLVFWRAVLCGVMMYLAVKGWKTMTSDLGRVLNCFLCVFIFVACGFEHCVADAAYMAMQPCWSTEKALFVLWAALGNSVGSLVLHLIFKRI